MADNHAESTEPVVRFKRRKAAHPRRVTDSALAVVEPQIEDDSVPNLKDILRNRKRPRDRLKEDARRSEPTRTEIAPVKCPREGLYTKARLAEQNFRQYGWPIPTHLQATLAEIAPDLKNHVTPTQPNHGPPTGTHKPPDAEQSIRTAAGMGRIEEVDVEPVSKRTDERWTRLDNGEYKQVATGKVRLGRDGKPRRTPKRRNSEDVRRDQMVEAILSESKLDYFDAQAPANSHADGAVNNDEAILAQFQADYYESVEEARKQQRKAAPAPLAKGAKEPPKGPKLGGSKSVRAKMRLAEEQAARTKR
ncbi:hypothetical protein BDU57DRAFT_556504 [Ampelomyces quisqualis]|uniref:Hepatocellular carcinoma-associated antigen 59-domain-containing protein n=1 Tax=Ampelomyces quisqualis TaxID=50730 RepID=A0A6A5QQE8_AMPQU|nr:hypothetical protein BDU57DRAFT_556504 [Ampelomyces quisqualis]